MSGHRVERAVASVVALGFALAAAGCSSGDSAQEADTAPAERRPVPTLVEVTAVEGGSARANSFLKDVVRGMEATSLEEISIGRAGAGRPKNDGKAVAIRFETIPAETVRRQWDQWIVTGAFSRRLLAAGLPAAVHAQDSRGSFTARPRLKGEPDPAPLTEKREAAIVEALRRSAGRANADVVTLELHRPYGTAIALTLAPADTVGFLKTRLRPLLADIEAHRVKLEGFYLAVLDEDGELALEWGSWTRNPAGVYWVRRDLANCSPIRQSDPPGSPRPSRCPD